MRILLVEDDPMLGEGLRSFLTHRGQLVEWCEQLAQADLLKSEPFDAFVVDWNLPDGSGLDWIRGLRSRGYQVPILIMTARDRLSERVAGLEVGADDFLVKPFHPEELLARIRANCRRAASRVLLRMQLGSLALDIQGRIATVEGQEVALTAREWQLLEVLIRRQGRYVSKRDLDSLITGMDTDTSSNALEVHVSSLRRKLGRQLIETARGLGYRITA